MTAAIPWVNALYPLAGVALAAVWLGWLERRVPRDGRETWEPRS